LGTFLVSRFTHGTNGAVKLYIPPPAQRPAAKACFAIGLDHFLNGSGMFEEISLEGLEDLARRFAGAIHAQSP
jgi:hypothetical protein